MIGYLEILDLQGRMIANYQDIQSDNYMINFEHLNSGNYLLIINIEAQKVFKIIDVE